jgi:hypothetical protein
MFTLILLSCGGSIKVRWDKHNATISKATPTLKVYIENSGSMDGYMCNGSELKDALYDYVSSLKSYSKQTLLYYINSQIVPYGGSIHNFIWDLTPQTFANVAGSHANSVIGQMLETITNGMDKNTISVFVSDCILDVPNGNATQFFRMTQTDIKNVVLSKVGRDNNFAVEIIQLNSKFVGNYYGTDGTTKLSGQERPYYIWIMGDKNKIAYLNSQVKLSKIQHGYNHCASFSTQSEISYDLYNQFSVTDKRPIDKGRALDLRPGRDGYTLLIKANLYSTLLDDKSIAGVSTYKPLTPYVKVEKAETVDDKDYPHLITLHISSGKSFAESIAISNNDLPKWVTDSNDDTGRNIMQNLSKTSGIKYIIGGVSDAYSNCKEKANVKFTISE